MYNNIVILFMTFMIYLVLYRNYKLKKERGIPRNMKEPEELWKIQYPDGSFSIKTWHSEKKLSMHLMNNPKDYVVGERSKSDAVCFSLEEKSRTGVKDVINEALLRKGERKSTNELKIAQLIVEKKERELEEAKRRLQDVQKSKD